MLFDNNEIDTEQEKNAVSEQASKSEEQLLETIAANRKRRIIDQGQ